jgi:hypothetical protein
VIQEQIEAGADSASRLQGTPDQLTIEAVLRFIFSGLVLMAISVIICGKFLAQRIRLSVRSRQIFRIPLVILHISATDDEVILGFTGLIITLALTGSAFGKQGHLFFVDRFGIDPGQFNSLCILSAFLAVVWSFALFLILGVRSQSPLGPVAAKHQTMIENLTPADDKPDDTTG